MRLISCHIENFGKLSDETFIFNGISGLNIICRDNGWGKSTFATFIKVMFYGFDNEGKRNEIENERRHFKPWQGGVYGGQITFEADGKSYIMSRTFGSKEKDDEFILQDAETNLETTDFSMNIGEELFQIDSASFSRSIYISQNDCKATATDKINAKLGNLADSTDDLNNFEIANKKITDKLNSLSKRRKTGILYKQKEQIADLKQKIKNGQSIDDSMDELLKLKNDLNESYMGLKDEQKLLQEKQKAISEYKDLEVKKNEYKHLCDDFDKKQSIFEQKAAYFSEKIPETDEVDKYIKIESDDSLLKKELDIYNMDEGELSQFNLLEKRFASDIPDSETISEKYQNVQFMQELIQRIEKSMLTAEEQNELKRLSDKFLDGIPTQEALDYISKAWSVRTEKKNTLSSKKATADILERAGAGYTTMPNQEGNIKTDGTEATMRGGADNKHLGQSSGDNSNITGVSDGKKRNNIIGIILMQAIIITGVLGIYLLTKSLTVCALFAVIAIFIDIVITIKIIDSEKAHTPENSNYIGNANGQNLSGTPLNDETGRTNLYNDLRSEISEDEELIAKAEKETENFLGRCKILFDENSVVADLYGLREDVKSYLYLSQKSQQEDIGTLQKQYMLMKDGIISFLKKYGFLKDATDMRETDNLMQYRNLLHSLEKDANNYIMLKEKKSKFDSALASHEKNIVLLETFIKELDMEIKDDIYAQLQEMKEVLRDYIKSKEECDKAEELKKEYEAKHEDIESIKNAELKEELSLAEIEERQSEISLEIEKYHTSVNDYNHQLEKLQEKKDDIMDTERQLEELQEIFAQNEKKEKILQKTQQYLGQAKAALVAKYTKPVKDSFDKYFNILSDIEAESYQLDADFNMSVIEQGLPREIGFLSTGYQDMVGVCMRMALVDAMYEGEKPFVVFDDPFVNFDRKKTEGGLKMLGEIAKKYQVIYFTCNEVRGINN